MSVTITLEKETNTSSTCEVCKSCISLSEHRVSFANNTGRRNRKLTLHTGCFLRGVWFQGGGPEARARGSCGLTRRRFSEGEARLAVNPLASPPAPPGGAGGSGTSSTSSCWVALGPGGEVIHKVLAAAPTWGGLNQLNGYHLLTESERAVFGSESSQSVKKRKASELDECDKLGSPLEAIALSGGERGGAGGSEEKEEVAVEEPPTPPVMETEQRDQEHAAQDDHLCDYEQQRLENIRRNQARMQALQLQALASNMPQNEPATRASASQRGLQRPSKPKKTAAPLLARRSLRQQGVTAKGQFAAGVDREMAGGKVLLFKGMEKLPVGTTLEVQRKDATQMVPGVIEAHGEESGTYKIKFDDKSVEVVNLDDGKFNLLGEFKYLYEPESKPKVTGPLPFQSLNGDPATDSKFLENLSKSSTPVSSRAPIFAASFKKITLSEERVAKVVKNGVTHLQFHPREDDLMVAAGDKDGHVGLWSVENASEGDDGVLLLKPHNQYISGLLWRTPKGGPSTIYTCSYDGSIRTLDYEKSMFTEVHRSEDDEYSAFEVSKDCSTVYVGDNEGNFHVLDTRACKVTRSFRMHQKKINTLSLEQTTEHYLASSSSDRTVCVWDVRNLGHSKAKPLSTLTHGKTVQAAQFSSDGSGRLLTTSMDDTVRVWSPIEEPGSAVDQWQKGKAFNPCRLKHNNQTGRWIIPFRAVWTPASDAFIIGNMKRSFEVFGPSKGELIARHTNEDHMTAIPSRNCVHPTLPVIAASSGSGRVYVYK